jgi:hypothetical protein
LPAVKGGHNISLVWFCQSKNRFIDHSDRKLTLNRLASRIFYLNRDPRILAGCECGLFWCQLHIQQQGRCIHTQFQVTQPEIRLARTRTPYQQRRDIYIWRIFGQDV